MERSRPRAPRIGRSLPANSPSKQRIVPQCAASRTNKPSVSTTWEVHSRPIPINDGAGSERSRTDQPAGELVQKRYDSGYVNLLDVINVRPRAQLYADQRTVLATERASAQLAAQRLNNSVSLIKSIGGTWTTEPVATLSTPDTSVPLTKSNSNDGETSRVAKLYATQRPEINHPI